MGWRAADSCSTWLTILSAAVHRSIIESYTDIKIRDKLKIWHPRAQRTINHRARQSENRNLFLLAISSIFTPQTFCFRFPLCSHRFFFFSFPCAPVFCQIDRQGTP